RQTVVDSFKPLLLAIPDEPPWWANIFIGITNFFGSSVPTAKASGVSGSGADSIDPTTQDVAVVLSATEGQQFRAVIPSGSFSNNSSRTSFTFKDKTGTTAGGIVAAKIVKKDPGFKVSLAAVDPAIGGLLKSTLEFVLQVGAQTFDVQV